MPQAALDLKLASDGREFANVPLDTLRTWVAERRVTRRDWVRYPGTQHWISVAQVPDLAASLPTARPSPGPSASERNAAAFRSEPPVTGRPLTGNPQTGTPLTGTPSAGSPVAGSPVAGSPTAVGSSPGGVLPDAAFPSGPARNSPAARNASQGGAETDAELGISEPTNRRRRRQKKRLEETEMDMTPMIDVTFQLLIFFMFANQLANPNPIDVPEARYGRGVSPDGVQMILVDDAGQYYLGESTKPDNISPSLDALVDEVRDNADMAQESLDVIISAHRQARHQNVRQLVERLERLDGVGQVRLGVEEVP